MARRVPPRTKEYVSSSGTADFTLNGPVGGDQVFSNNLANSDTCPYAAQDNAGNWEEGEGSYNSSTNTLVRDSSPNSNAGIGTKATFGAGLIVWVNVGSKDVGNMMASSKSYLASSMGAL